MMPPFATEFVLRVMVGVGFAVGNRKLPTATPTNNAIIATPARIGPVLITIHPFSLTLCSSGNMPFGELSMSIQASNRALELGNLNYTTRLNIQ